MKQSVTMVKVLPPLTQELTHAPHTNFIFAHLCHMNAHQRASTAEGHQCRGNMTSLCPGSPLYLYNGPTNGVAMVLGMADLDRMTTPFSCSGQCAASATVPSLAGGKDQQ